MKKYKKQLLKVIVYLLVISIFTWLIQQTTVEYMRGETTFAVSKETKESIVPPAIIFCPIHDWDNGILTQANISDKDWFFSQFFHLKLIMLQRWFLTLQVTLSNIKQVN